MKLGINIVIGIPTTSMARRSPSWIDGIGGLQGPLGSGATKIWAVDRPIADARNEICVQALKVNANYVFFVADDVIPPHNAIIESLYKINRTYNGVKASMITGVYWTKTNPPEPYLYKVGMSGPFKDWKAGDFFPIDLAGCDCLLIDTNVLKSTPYPWFSTDWNWNKDDIHGSLTTEDFYFFSKTRKHGFHLFADTSIQCLHEERSTGAMYYLSLDMPQAEGKRDLEEWKDKGELIAADLGAGLWSPKWPENIKVVRFDQRKDINIDVCCDISHLPEAYFNSFDIVHASHVLEHFGRDESVELVKHWAKLLKPKGLFKLLVPNVLHAINVIQLAHEKPGTINPDAQKYAWQQLYGDQQPNYETSYHKTGFTKLKLENLLKATMIFENIVVTETDDGQNLKAECNLIADSKFEAVSDFWEDILKQENLPSLLDTSGEEVAAKILNEHTEINNIQPVLAGLE